jgi:protein O-GlcNAc transferase
MNPASNDRPPVPSPAELNQLRILFNAGRYAEVENRARWLLEQYPDSGVVWELYGMSLQIQRKDALHAFHKTVELMPDDAGALYNLGVALKSRGKPDSAVDCYRRAIKLKPGFAEAHGNLGNALRDLGQLDEAVDSYRQAIKLKPDSAEVHNNLGTALNALGQFEGAVTSCLRAVEIKPDYTEAHYNLGKALKELGQFEDALKSYHRALELNPDSADTHFNIGIVLQSLGELEGAVVHYRRALGIKPDNVKVCINLGVVLKQLGQLDAALASYQRALEIKPDYAEAYSNMLYLHAFTRNISPESECSLSANWENIALDESQRAAAHGRSFDYPPRSGRKLRIGVVSAEIGQHAVAEFLEPFLGHLDRSRFHITLFPTVLRTESRAVRLKELADEHTPLAGISDDKAADLIRAGQIDILVDTTAHMGNCRLGIFAHRAAPVQCHYIGYHGSTGLTEMDWFIADEILLPAFCDNHFREDIWRLPRLWISYLGDASLPDSRWVPSVDGTVWLGSFNNLTKVREESLALWAKVMNAIPESKLFLKDRQGVNPAIQERIRKEMSRHGISADRIEFAGQVPDWRSHMALYDKLDIALDTIPLNSGTTAFDALWMGVPLVALEGSWMGARMTNAILNALGKPEWIAHSEDEYVAVVTALARDVEGRKSLRATQRRLMAESPLCDARGLTRALEDAFEKMFDQWMKKSESDFKDSGTI